MPGPAKRGQGGTSRPLQEARPVREGVEQHRRAEEPRRSREGRRHRSREGWTHRRHRSSRIPACLARRTTTRARTPALYRQDRRGQDHRTRPQPQQRGALASRLARRDPKGAARRLPQQPEAGRASSRRHLLGRQLRCFRGPGWHGRTDPRVRAQLEAHRPPEPSRRGGRRGRRGSARRRLLQGAHLVVLEGHAVRPLAGLRR